MTDVDIALSQISSIRSQLAASTHFRGFTPTAEFIACALVLLFTVLQAALPGVAPGDAVRYAVVWGCFLSLLIGISAWCTGVRARRVHGDGALRILGTILQRILPFAATGAVMSWVVLRFAPETAWILPGTWQMLIALLGFSLINTVPFGLHWAACWYFVSGACVMALAAQGQPLSPWMMGVPLAIGQVLVAVALNRAYTRGECCVEQEA